MWLPLAADRRSAVVVTRPQGAQSGPQGREERLHGRGRRRRTARRLLQGVRAQHARPGHAGLRSPVLRRGAARVSRRHARVRRARGRRARRGFHRPSAGATASRCPGPRRSARTPRSLPTCCSTGRCCGGRFEHGYRTFDFGRSTPDEGTFHFKKQWGAQPQELAWEYLGLSGALPDQSPKNPKFRAAIALWQHLPVPVATATWTGHRPAHSVTTRPSSLCRARRGIRRSTRGEASRASW